MVCPNCFICSEVFGQDTEVIVTRCGHLFHNNCILRWLESSEKCPQCEFSCTNYTNLKVHLNWDPIDTPNRSNVDAGTENEDNNVNILGNSEPRINLSETNEDILILTQTQQRTMFIIFELDKKIIEQDRLILNYIKTSHQLEKDIAFLQSRIYSLERASEKKAAKQKKLVGVLQKNLKMMCKDLSREAQLRIDERLLQLENNIIKAVIREENEQGSSSKNKCTSSKASPNTEKDLLQLAKKKAKDVGWKSVWERKGRILARKDYTSEVLYIGNVKALRQMI